MKKRIIAALLPAVLALASGSAIAGAAGNFTIPVYPGAVARSRPAGVGFKTPPAGAKTYATSESFATVKAWYEAQLHGYSEVHQPDMEKTEAAFLVGNAYSGNVVLVESYNGKTWIVIGPPF